MSVGSKNVPRSAVERVEPAATAEPKGVLDALRRYASDYPHKFFGYILFLGMLALSPLVAANLYVEAFEFREWACPALPKPVARRAGCPERTPESTPKVTAPGSARLDPRAELKDTMGIAWNEENFWAAVKRGDGRATELFLQGDMTISGAQLHGVLLDDVISRKAPLAVLVKYAPGRSTEFCESDDADLRKKASEHRSLLRFANYVREQRIAIFIRDFCRETALNSQLQRRIDVETATIADQERQAATNRKRRDDCVNRFDTREYHKRWVRLQTERVLLICNHADIRDELEKGLCEYHFPGWPSAGETEADFHAGVRSFCAGRFPIRAVETATRQGLQLVLDRLSMLP